VGRASHLCACSPAAVERTWRVLDSQGQILALALMTKSLQRFEVFPLRSEAVRVQRNRRTAVCCFSAGDALPSEAGKLKQEAYWNHAMRCLWGDNPV